MKTRLEMVKEAHYRRSPLYAAFLLELAEIYRRQPAVGVMVDTKTGAKQEVFDLTSRTDGKMVEVNLNFLESLSLMQGDTLFCHEEMHVILKHPLRRAKHLKWMKDHGMDECHICSNIAEDQIINDSLKEEGKDELPGWMHADKASTKTVLELLPGVYQTWHKTHKGGDCTCGSDQEGPQDAAGEPQAGSGEGDGTQSPPKPKKGKGKGQGKGCPQHGGCCQGAGDLSEAEMKELEKKIDQAVIQAARIAQKRGTVPAWAKRHLEEITVAKMNWIEKTRQWVDARVPTDYSWSRPRKQNLAFGSYTPSFSVESVGAIAIFVDTSGSIGDDLLKVFGSEMQGIFSQLRPLELHVLYIDAAVAGYEKFDRADFFKLNPAGGGGTSFRPGYEYLKQKGIEVRGVIYLTDLYGDWKEMQDPGVDTLFVSPTPPEQAKEMIGSWGKYVHIRMDV